MNDQPPSQRAEAPAARRSLAVTALLTVVRLAIPAVSIAVALVFAKVLFDARPQPTPAPAEDGTPIVESVLLEPTAVTRVWRGYGRAAALDEVRVPAEVGAVVIERAFGLEAGSAVNAGDVLVRLDATDFRQRLDSANASLARIDAELASLEVEFERLGDQIEQKEIEIATLERDYQRDKDVLDRGAGNAREVDRSLATLSLARVTLASLRQQLELIPSRRLASQADRASAAADVRVAERDLERTVIRAPIAGRLTEFDAEVGEFATASQVMAQIVSLERIEAAIRLPLEAASWVKEGDTIDLAPDGPTERSWTGVIERIAPIADEQSRTLAVYAVISQPGANEQGPGSGTLRPGQFVLGSVETPTGDPLWVVPRRSVIDSQMTFVRPTNSDERVGFDVVTVDVKPWFTLAAPPINAETPGEWLAIASPRPGAGPLQTGDRAIVTNLIELGSPERVRIEGDLSAMASTDSGLSTPTEKADAGRDELNQDQLDRENAS